MATFHFQRVQFVARAIAQKSHGEWKEMSEEERREALTLARRALQADMRYAARRQGEPL